jgi:hypothetical protein
MKTASTMTSDEIDAFTASERARLEAAQGQVWNTIELQKDFEVKGFMAPFVVVKRKSDGQKGSLCFQHSPRFYFGFEPVGD